MTVQELGAYIALNKCKKRPLRSAKENTNPNPYEGLKYLNQTVG